MFDETVVRKLDDIERRFLALEERLSDSSVLGNPDELRKVAKDRAELEELVTVYRDFRRLDREVQGSVGLLADQDAEMRALAESELPALREQRAATWERLKILLTPKDPNDVKNVVLEIRAGTGGDEAALFAANLFRMYARYAETRRWRVEVLSSHATGIGGYKEIISLLEGKGAYSELKYEAGVHRVQRVPQTESQGRIHTSTATVAVLPEAEDVDVRIDEKDLRIDVMRAGGPGGQSVNTTDSAVRVTHIPSGMTVHCQDEKSQHKNKAKALKILRARLLEREREDQRQREVAERRGQVGTGDRSERIRTYNFPQSRMTDHRIGLTVYRLAAIIEGDLGEIIERLRTYYQAEALRAPGTEASPALASDAAAEDSA